MIRSFLILLFFLSAGCGVANRSSAPWKQISTKGPLSGPNEIAVFESRQYWSSIMAAGVTSDYRFTASGGRTIDSSRLARGIVSFLEKKGHLSKWPDSHSYIDGRSQKLAPYTIHVISIFPTIIVLSPHDYGEVRGSRSVSDIVGWAPRESLDDDRLLNHITFGTSVGKADSLFWFSPDLGIDITPASTSSAGEFIIDHPKVKILGRSVESSVQFIRK